MKTSRKNPITQSSFFERKCITAKWIFSPGDLVEPDDEEEVNNDDFCWETAVAVDFDDHSSILNDDVVFAEEVVETSHKHSGPQSFFVETKRITAKWIFSPGDSVQAEEEAVDSDFCSERTVSTVPVDYDDDSCIMYEDELAEEVVDLVTQVGQAPHDDMNENENVSSPTAPKENEMLQRFYKEFKERSSLTPSHEPKRRISCPVRLTNSARGSSTGTRKSRRTQWQSERNCALIRLSITNLLDF